MIVVDIETSGLNPMKNGIIELAAIKLESPEIFYHNYCRLDRDDEIDSKALEINGQTEEDIRSLRRPTQKQVLNDFFNWIKYFGEFYIAGENIGNFDWMFIKTKADKYGLNFPLQYRTYDLNTLAQVKYERIFGRPLVIGGKSNMDLTKILEFVGMRDNRKNHTALEDCKLEAECISRLRHGKGLFLGYSKFKIPGYLKNDNL